jgi:hypothetical protein
VAVKVAEVVLAATLTEAGTVNTDGTLLESATTVLVAVAFDSMTVQVVLALEARLAAGHCSEDIVGRVAGGIAGPVTVTSSMMSSLASYPPNVRYS